MTSPANPIPVYCIPGLGADHRVFARLRLPEGFAAEYLDWIPPARKEKLEEYAARMAERITTDQPFVLLGLSMGGMVATEIAKRRPALGVVLLSSIPSAHSLPFYYRWAGRIYLPQLVPISLLRSASAVKRIFTSEQTEDKKLILQMIRDTDPRFIRWAMTAIVQWQGEAREGKLLHIHGTADGLLPVRYTHPTHRIAGAGHMMVFTHATEINRILSAELPHLYTSAV